MTREELFADIDKAVADFATQLAQTNVESTGIPKPPQIEVTESQLDPPTRGSPFADSPQSAISEDGLGGGGGGGIGLVYGACCVAGDCSIQTEADCGEMDGEYQGNNVECADVTCLTGACCEGSICSIHTEGGCPGVYQGDGTDCDPNPCLSTCPCSPLGNSLLPGRYFTSLSVFYESSYPFTALDTCVGHPNGDQCEYEVTTVNTAQAVCDCFGSSSSGSQHQSIHSIGCEAGECSHDASYEQDSPYPCALDTSGWDCSASGSSVTCTRLPDFDGWFKTVIYTYSGECLLS